MASVAARRKAKAEALNEQQRREEERRQFKAAQELESLRRTFKRINKRGDGKICTQDLVEVSGGGRGVFAACPIVRHAHPSRATPAYAGARLLGAQDH